MAIDETGADHPVEGDWQHLWVSTLEYGWASLALVPTEPGIPIQQIAASLVAAGTELGARPVRLINAVGTRFVDAQKVVDAIATMTGSGDLVIVSVDPLADSPASLPIVRAASGALVVVRLGQSRLSAARSTVEAIGSNRVFGSFVVE